METRLRLIAIFLFITLPYFKAHAHGAKRKESFLGTISFVREFSNPCGPKTCRVQGSYYVGVLTDVDANFYEPVAGVELPSIKTRLGVNQKPSCIVFKGVCIPEFSRVRIAAVIQPSYLPGYADVLRVKDVAIVEPPKAVKDLQTVCSSEDLSKTQRPFNRAAALFNERRSFAVTKILLAQLDSLENRNQTPEIEERIYRLTVALTSINYPNLKTWDSPERVGSAVVEAGRVYIRDVVLDKRDSSYAEESEKKFNFVNDSILSFWWPLNYWVPELCDSDYFSKSRPKDLWF